MERAKADEIVRRHQRAAPVRVMEIAVELGLAVWRSPGLGKNVSGKLFRDAEHGGPSGYSILVNAAEPYVRQRFTMAHEIGHFVLHLDKIGDELVDNTFYRSRLSNALEAQANQYAADILMPFALIDTLMNGGLSEPDELAEALGVSPVAMKIRLGIPVPS
jgi:hypothetical protein